MTQKLKNVKHLLYICLAMFLLNSCTEEKEYLKNNRDLKFEEKSFKELLLLKDFNTAYQRVKTEKQKNIASRSALENEYNFTIVEGKDVKIINIDGKTFYNILIQRDSVSAAYFENLLIMSEKINNNDEISAYIMKYATPDGYMKFDSNANKEISPLFERISMYCYKVCVTLCHDLRINTDPNYVGPDYSVPHSPGASCNNISFIHTECGSTCEGANAGTQYGMGGTFTVSTLTTGTTQITGSGSNGSTEIVTAPVYGGTLSDDEPIEDVDPCEHLNSLTSESTTGNLRAGINNLKMFVNNMFLNNKENGIEVKKGLNYDGSVKYTSNYVFSNNETNILLATNGYFVGACHTHPKNGDAIPSFGDLMWLRDCYNEARDSFKGYVFSMVVAKHKGTNEVVTYSMKIDNFAALDNLVNSIWNHTDYAGMSDFEKMKKIHFLEAERYAKNNLNYEKVFLQKYATAGISLYKASGDLNSWNKLTLAPNPDPASTSGLVVTPVPCNN